MHLQKDNYIYIPGRDGQAVSRGESDVMQIELSAHICINTDSSEIKAGSRDFLDQNFAQSSFLLWVREKDLKNSNFTNLPSYDLS